MGGYWEAEGTFPPTGTTIEYFVEADDDGPTQSNIEAFALICSSYDAILNQAHAVVSGALAQSKDDPLPVTRLIVCGIEIPGSPLADSQWELSLSGPRDEHFAIPFRGLHALGHAEASL